MIEAQRLGISDLYRICFLPKFKFKLKFSNLKFDILPLPCSFFVSDKKTESGQGSCFAKMFEKAPSFSAIVPVTVPTGIFLQNFLQLFKRKIFLLVRLIFWPRYLKLKPEIELKIMASLGKGEYK